MSTKTTPSQGVTPNTATSTPAAPLARRDLLRRVMGSVGSLTVARAVAATAGVGALTALTGCEGDTTFDATYVPYWTLRADTLEAYQLEHFQTLRTADNPGNQNPVAHAPVVTMNNGVATIQIDHPMVIEHWITTVYVRDRSTNKVIYFQELMPPNPTPNLDPASVKGIGFEVIVPEGVPEIAVYSYCNLHELWVTTSPVA